MEHIIKLPAGSLASRIAAKPIREKILKILNANQSDIVLIDLADTDVISGSYGDECIGVIVKYTSYDTVTKRIKLINGNKSVCVSIAQSILERKQELDNTVQNNHYNVVFA